MNALSMVSMQVSLRDLRQIAIVQGFLGDEGRMLHHALSEAFGKGVVQPFRLMPGRNGNRHATLYGYARADEKQLRQTAQDFATPEISTLLTLDTLKIKTMPDQWSAGRRLAFDVRLRPVRRLVKPMDAQRASYRKGAEIDALFVHLGRSGMDQPPQGRDALILRENVYRTWLQERLSGASLDMTRTRMARFSCSQSLRYQHGGAAPDAVFHGELTVTDSMAFQYRLAQGIGRHTAYGFGMLLLRPAVG